MEQHSHGTGREQWRSHLRLTELGLRSFNFWRIEKHNGPFFQLSGSSVRALGEDCVDCAGGHGSDGASSMCRHMLQSPRECPQSPGITSPHFALAQQKGVKTQDLHTVTDFRR